MLPLPRPAIRRRSLLSVLACLLAMAGPSLAGDPAAAILPSDLHAVTYNIRYGSAKDGPDAWHIRRPHVITLLNELDPDLILLQEVEAAQLDQLAEALDTHSAIGVGRDDGKRRGEHVPIFFRTARFTLLDSGTFWLSDTPETPGSSSWGNEIPRVCTWARLEDARSGDTLSVFNVHFDHRSQPSRERSIQAVLGRAHAEIEAGHHVVIGGDFNAAPENPVHRSLVDHPIPWTDAHSSLHPENTTSTFNSFDPGRTEGAVIDFIYTSPGLSAFEAEIVLTRTPEGRWPSDHFPVRARLKIDGD